MIRWEALRSYFPPESGPNVFVKMDIEGAEYDVLPELLRDAPRMSGMVIEFHQCGQRWPEFARAMDTLQHAFAIVHIHGNNLESLIPDSDVPRTMEVTVVNRTLLRGALTPSSAAYPISRLDQPNNAIRPDYPLVFDR